MRFANITFDDGRMQRVTRSPRACDTVSSLVQGQRRGTGVVAPERAPFLATNDEMLIVIGILLFIGWLMAKFMWNVASMGVHVLLVAAVIAMIFHFVRGRTSGGRVGS